VAAVALFCTRLPGGKSLQLPQVREQFEGDPGVRLRRRALVNGAPRASRGLSSNGTELLGKDRPSQNPSETASRRALNYRDLSLVLVSPRALN
jgi:hypothetical protein